jgi:D-alanyl-D-alanine carboxypeptidase (penicillin-binding protein 5/6)
MASETSKDRVKDAAALLDYGFANCKKYESPDLNAKLKAITVNKGEEPEVEITVKKPFQTILTADESEDKITWNIQRKKSLNAPVKKGATAGWITYYYDGTYIGKSRLVTKKRVKKLTFSKSIKRMMQGYFT